MQLPLALALTLLPSEAPLLGTSRPLMQSTFCRTYACTFVSQEYRMESGDDWVYRFRLNVPGAEIRIRVNANTQRLAWGMIRVPQPPSAQALNMVGDFVQQLTGRRFNRAALQGCVRNAARTDLNLDGYFHLLTQTTTTTGQPFKARCGSTKTTEPFEVWLGQNMQ